MHMIERDVKGPRYQQLIDLLLRHCNRFAFVEREDMMVSEDINYLKDSISEHLIEKRTQTEWETTKLLEDTADIYYYHLNHATRLFLKEHSTSLFNWMAPELPEDLMFYNKDRCLLAVCSHEKFFLVDETFWSIFEKKGDQSF